MHGIFAAHREDDKAGRCISEQGLSLGCRALPAVTVPRVPGNRLTTLLGPALAGAVSASGRE